MSMAVMTMPTVTSIASCLGNREGHRGEDSGQSKVKARHADKIEICSRNRCGT